MSSYQLKYLKYKNKYLDLKKQLGGDPNVFIMISTGNFSSPNKVVSARDYQEESLNDYISKDITEITYTPRSGIIFTIKKYNKGMLEGDYDDFYTLTREDGSVSIMSRNKEKLESFCGYANRLTSY